METTTIRKPDGRCVPVEMRLGRRGHPVVLTPNYFIFFIVAAEIVILAALITLNYFLRFDPDIRTESDFYDYEKISLSCNPNLIYQWSYPYYSYEETSKKSLEGISLNFQMPEWVFFLCLLIVPIGIIVIVESWYGLYPYRVSKEILTTGDWVIPQVIRRITRIVGVFLLGASFTGLLVCVLKFSLVSPRPHLLSVCFNRTESSSNPWEICNMGEYFWQPFAKCLKTVPQEDIVEALNSHPSYHASLAVYSGIFTIAYWSMVVTLRGVYGPPLGLFFCLLMMSTIGATHRLGTGHSFFIDVVIGAIIGAIVALFMTKVTLNRLEERIWSAKVRLPLANENDIMEHAKEPSVNKIDDKHSDDGHSSESEASEPEYKANPAQIPTMIPRARPPTIPQTAHAINSNFSGRPNESIGLNRMSSSSMQNLHTARNDKNVRHHHSSLSRVQGQAWVTQNSALQYNSPRQRVSADNRDFGPPNSQSRYAYDGPFLSAYRSEGKSDEVF